MLLLLVVDAAAANGCLARFGRARGVIYRRRVARIVVEHRARGRGHRRRGRRSVGRKRRRGTIRRTLSLQR